MSKRWMRSCVWSGQRQAYAAARCGERLLCSARTLKLLLLALAAAYDRDDERSKRSARSRGIWTKVAWVEPER